MWLNGIFFQMYTTLQRCSKPPPPSSTTSKGPLKARPPRESSHHYHHHKSGVCDYCWNLDAPTTPTLYDETSAGLSDNPFTEDDDEIDDGAFSESSLSSCLDEDCTQDKSREKADLKQLSASVECEVIRRRRVIRRRIAKPSPLPSQYQVSYNSQEATSGSGIS